MSAQKKRRWSPVRATAPVAALLVLVALAANGVAGCSSTADEVKEYLEVAGGVLDGIEASLAELDGLWQVPLAARGEIKENVLQFRTVIDKGKAEVDGTDAPQPCGELSGLLRQCLERGRELVNMYSHFADYIDDIAPVAQKMDELMTTLLGLMERNDIPTGFSALYEKVSEINNSYGAMFAHNTFQEVHKEFGEFAQRIAGEFKKAHDRLCDWGFEDEEEEDIHADEEAVEEEEEEEEESQAGKETPENRAIEPILSDIPEEWGAAHGEVAAMLEALRHSTGLSQLEAAVRDLISQARAEMEALEEEYP